MRYRLQRHDGTDCSATMVPFTVLRLVPIQRYRQNIFSMNKQLLKRIIVEKQVAIPTYKLITRAMRFEKRANYVLVGLRRAGKSYLLYQDIQTKIHEKEITAEHILYIIFEDERLLGMQTEELDNLLEA